MVDGEGALREQMSAARHRVAALGACAGPVEAQPETRAGSGGSPQSPKAPPWVSAVKGF